VTLGTCAGWGRVDENAVVGCIDLALDGRAEPCELGWAEVSFEDAALDVMQVLPTCFEYGWIALGSGVVDDDSVWRAVSHRRSLRVAASPRASGHRHPGLLPDSATTVVTRSHPAAKRHVQGAQPDRAPACRKRGNDSAELYHCGLPTIGMPRSTDAARIRRLVSSRSGGDKGG
jgi:hypothetical protein